MKVGIYARRSRADEVEGSIPVQLAECRDRAEAEGWEVVGEYVDDGISAYAPKRVRPEYERLIADVEAGRVDAPLAADMDRLLRQDREGTRWLQLWEDGRVRHLKFTDEGDIDLNRALDERNFKERVAAAVYYCRRLSEKIRRTNRRKAEAGEWNGGGRRPFGYRIEKHGGRYRLVKDPAEAALIKAAAKRVLAAGSMYSVMSEWNLPGGPRKDSGSRWTMHDVRRVLLSPQVAGLRVHNGNGTVARGTWEPILTEDEHENLKARLSDPARRAAETEDRVARTWALAGLTRCTKCGTPLSGAVRKVTLKSGDVAVRRSYSCNAVNGGCGGVSITAPNLERHVIAAALKRPEPEPSAETPRPTKRETDLLKEMRELEARKDRIGDALADGLDPKQARRSLARLDEKLTKLRRELGRVAEKPHPTRRYLHTMPEADAFLNGEQSVLPPDWAADANEWLRAEIGKVSVRPARAQGVRFDPSRVKIAWR